MKKSNPKLYSNLEEASVLIESALNTPTPSAISFRDFDAAERRKKQLRMKSKMRQRQILKAARAQGYVIRGAAGGDLNEIY